LAIGDKYVLTLSGHVVGDISNVINNVFAYEAASAGCNAAGLSDGFGVDVLTDIANICSSAMSFDQILVVNLDDPADFNIEPISIYGAGNSAYMPKFVAFGFEYVRAVRGVHNGRKSFGVIAEDAVVDGSAASAVVADLNTLAGKLAANVVDAATNDYIPRIWRRAGSYGTPPASFPDTYYPISGVVYKAVGSQNTRKK